MATPEKDDVTGTETTGHEWDGIKELNTPLPRWWLWVFYATIVWSIGYWIVYPAWPTLSGHTTGVSGWSSRGAVAASLVARDESQQVFRDQIGQMGLQDIIKNPELMSFAVAGGRSVFGDRCAGCHGSAAQGAKGYPNLTDDAWLWGGSIEDIHATISYGIRSGHADARENQMPAFGRDQLLSREEVDRLADFVIALNGGVDAARQAHPEAATLFADNCAACHGDNGEGMKDLGAPNLADAIWLYGGEKADVITSINTGRGGIMPNWEGRLPSVAIKELAIYVHSLGGGE